MHLILSFFLINRQIFVNLPQLPSVCIPLLFTLIKIKRALLYIQQRRFLIHPLPQLNYFRFHHQDPLRVCGKPTCQKAKESKRLSRGMQL